MLLWQLIGPRSPAKYCFVFFPLGGEGNPLSPPCACMLSCFSHIRLFTTLWTVAHQAPLSVGFSRQEHWSGLPCSPPEDLPNPRMEPESLVSPALAGGFFITSTIWKAQWCVCIYLGKAGIWRPEGGIFGA